jgi:hypothetical protein
VTVFLDTGYFIAIQVEDDQWHKMAVAAGAARIPLHYSCTAAPNSSASLRKTPRR